MILAQAYHLNYWGAARPPIRLERFHSLGHSSYGHGGLSGPTQFHNPFPFHTRALDWGEEERSATQQLRAKQSDCLVLNY